MASIPPEAIRKLLYRLDGLTVYSPEVFIGAGFPADFVGRLTKSHRSVSSQKERGKGKASKPAPRTIHIVSGVDGLEALMEIAQAIGARVDTVQADGRIFRAAQLREAIDARLTGRIGERPD